MKKTTHNESLYVQGAKRNELMSLPVRKWNDKSTTYDSLMVLSDGKKHDSGWGLIVIVGCIDNSPVEIAVNCADDICWNFKQQPRMDCALPSRAMHFWCGEKGKYRVGIALSSTNIWLEA